MLLEKPTQRSVTWNLKNPETHLNYSNEKFILACESGELQKIKKLTINKSIIHKLLYLIPFYFNKNNNNKLQLQKCYYYAIKRSSSHGQLEVIKFLLESPYFNKYKISSLEQQDGFLESCFYGHLNLVKYFMDNKKLTQYIDVELGFFQSCKNETINVINYFIFEKKIQKTDSVSLFLNQENFQHIKKMFDTRELVKNLDLQLSNKNSKNLVKKTIKI